MRRRFACIIVDGITRPHLGASSREETAMSANENKALYRRWFEQVVNTGDLELADVLLAPEYTLHFPGLPGPADRRVHKELVTMFRAGFPDWVETVEDLIAEGDRVVARVVGRGTHLGEFQGISPTGTQVEAHGIGIGRIADGRIVESWAAYDALGLLQQLRALPVSTPDAAIKSS
jgi:ketosteroid isomerase-like protein